MEQRQKPRIVQDNDHPVAEIYVDGVRYGFTMINVNPLHHSWMLGILDRQMQEIHNRAYLKGQKEVINEHRRILRLPELP